MISNLISALGVEKAYALTLPVSSLGADITIQEMIINFGNVLIDTSWYVMAAIFIIGSFFYIASAGNESRKGFGKGMMIGAVIVVALISGAIRVFNLVNYIVFGVTFN